MPEYLAPGVYVEETSFRTKSIEGVSTTTTGFVGPTRYGPLYDKLEVITSLAEFEATYGDGQPIDFADGAVDNYMWQAARAFFTEGGKRLYVKRIYWDGQSTQDDDQKGAADDKGVVAPLTVTARHPGEYGNFHVRFTPVVGPNVLALQDGEPHVRGLSDLDVVILTEGSPRKPHIASAESYIDPDTGSRTWKFHEHDSPAGHFELRDLQPSAAGGDQIQVVTLTVSVSQPEPGAVPAVWAGLPPDPKHELGGAPDSMTDVFSKDAITAQGTPIVVEHGADSKGVDVIETLFTYAPAASPASPHRTIEEWLLDDELTVDQRSIDVLLKGGSDGERPPADYYKGVQRPDDTKTGLVALEEIDDISIVAAPGSSHNYLQDQDEVHAIVNNLISHAQAMRYRIAVVDAGNELTVQQVSDMRAQHDSSYAAFYYPWVEILDPVTNQRNAMPPSGFVAGIYARNDIQRAVYKAPANEVVNLAIGFEKRLNKAQQEVLNPQGVNCFRFFEGRGYRLWGARTMSSDSEWKYVNLRRYFAYLEHSIDKGTQWAVFEPNGERLWASVRGTIDDFLLNEWQNGALLGDKPEKAYFVKCDRSTMTQNDLDNGRLVCLIGVAPLRPAEFVIFRIGQWTADAKR